MRALVALWRRHWFAPAPLHDLAMARIVVVTILAILDRGVRAQRVALAAPRFFQPIPLLVWSGLAAQPTLATVELVARVETWLLVAAGAGFLARPALVGVLALQLVQEAWVNSLGKVTHATLPLLYALVFLALAPCRCALLRGRAPRSRSPDARWPIELCFVALSSFYWKAGVAKLLDGGLAWADGSTLQFHLVASGLAPAMWLAEHPGLCRVASVLVLTFELGAPLGVVRALRPAMLAGGVCFHLGTLCFLGIAFWPVVAFYLVFVPWRRLATMLVPVWTRLGHPRAVARRRDERRSRDRTLGRPMT
jgi:hypothetical protein